MLATKIVSEDGISYNLTPLGYVVLIAVVIVMLAVGFIVKDKKTHSVKRLVTSAMAIALATLTSFITIFKMPMGGSVTLFSMLFYRAYRILVWNKCRYDSFNSVWSITAYC